MTSEQLASGPDPEPAAPRSRARGLAVVGAVGAVVLVSGGAYAAAQFLGGGGTQPEDVLPASAFAFAKLDLDPSAGQKLAVYRLARAFPQTGADDEDDVRADLLRALLDGQDVLDYARDVEPWLGDRVGVAALPGPAGGEPVVVAALQHTDAGAAEAALAKVRDSGEPLAWAFTEDDYVLIGEEQAAVDAARDAAADAPLAEAEAYQRGLDALDGDQVVTAWSDLDALWAAVPQEVRGEAEGPFGALEPSGIVALGVHAEDGLLEVEGRGVGVSTGLAQEVERVAIGGAVRELPAGTLAAVAAAGLGARVGEVFDQVQDVFGGDVTELEDAFGLQLPEDLAVLLGDQTLVALLDVQEGQPQALVRTRTGDPARAEEIATSLVEGAGIGAVLRLDDGIVVATDEEVAARATEGGLGEQEVFGRAVPEAEGASLLVFADLDRALEVAQAEGAGGEELEDLRPLRAVGLTVSGGADGGFQLRLLIDP